MVYGPPFFFPLEGLPPLLVAYTPLAWVGVMLAGYAVGPWFTLPPGPATGSCGGPACCFLVTFGVVRALNAYGDPAPWACSPGGPLYTVLSFLNVSKVPAFPGVLCLTLGVACSCWRRWMAFGARCPVVAYFRGRCRFSSSCCTCSSSTGRPGCGRSCPSANR
jgi:uncharacterized membrane protein